MYSENTIYFSKTGKYALEVKRDNGDETFATVLFKTEGAALYPLRCDYVMDIKTINKILRK